jgi:N6-L-threonylcarbamoyladenine synthase
MKILAIETSCDDTSIAIVEGRGNRVRTLATVTASQIPLHRRYGGVVPEVAARAHAETIVPTIKEVFSQLGLDPERAMKKPPIEAIAVTCGPGLVTSLWVGVTTAKLLAREWGVPLFGVNHMIGHIYSSIADGSLPKFPVLALIVSGGHTELVWMKNQTSWKKIGATRDDAAGEAFDKFGKVLGLPYPGGPEIAHRALKGNAEAITFPRPMLNSPDFDFSFAGLKTSGRMWAEIQARTHKKLSPKLIADGAASYQAAIVEVITAKTVRAARQYEPKTILLGGGVAANDSLREKLAVAIAPFRRIKLLLPEKKYTTDNAAMIGTAAYFTKNKFKSSWRTLVANPSFEIK